MVEWEGYRQFVYKDHLGFETVGIGRCIAEDVGVGLSRFEAEWLLERDLERVEEELTSSFRWFDELSRCRKDAMISACFQLGLPKLKGFRNALDSMAQRDWQQAKIHFLDSRWHKQTPARAEQVATMIETNEYPD